MIQPKILIIEDEPRMRRLLELVLREPSYNVRTAADGQEGVLVWKKWQPNLVLSDLKMPKMDGIEVLRYRNTHFPDIPFILLTAFGTVETAVSAMKNGAFDYLTKPVDHDQMRELVALALAKQKCSNDEPTMIGSSVAMEDIRKEIALAATTDCSVLITGESGTGKELVARAIHNAHNGQEAPFVRINCPAIPGDLLESELFGHLEGAFTGAVRNRQGAFVAADNGTLFLDEIGDLPLSLQPKLLHAVEQKQVTPVGGAKSQNVHVKIVAATNQHLDDMAASGQFRSDLLYRLNTIPLRVPPLRERIEDIQELACYFLQQFSLRQGSPLVQMDCEASQRLTEYDWPGNIRELKNIIERGCLQADHGIFPTKLIQQPVTPKQPASRVPLQSSSGLNLVERECDLIIQALETSQWNQSQAARKLGLTRNTLRYRIKKYGIHKEPE